MIKINNNYTIISVKTPSLQTCYKYIHLFHELTIADLIMHHNVNVEILFDLYQNKNRFGIYYIFLVYGEFVFV